MSDGSGLAHVGIRELRNTVSALVRRAGQGERIVVTVDGEPVAQLGPLGPDGGGPTLDDLAAAGLVTPPRIDPGTDGEPTMPPPSVVPADVRLDRLIDQVRGR